MVEKIKKALCQKIILTKVHTNHGTPCDALTLYRWSDSVNRHLAESLKKRRSAPPCRPCSSERTSLLRTNGTWGTVQYENLVKTKYRTQKQPLVASISIVRLLCSQVPPSVSSSESYSYLGLTLMPASRARACASMARRFANTYSYIAFI